MEKDKLGFKYLLNVHLCPVSKHMVKTKEENQETTGVQQVENIDQVSKRIL